MTTLTATAIITAVDRASAVFAQVGAAARAQAGKFAAATAAINNFANTAATGLGVPGALVGALALRGEYEADKALRVMQSIGEVTAEQRKMLEKSAFDNAIQSGVQAIELIKAQQEFLASGLDADTASALTDTIGKVSRANSILANQVAETGINVANAMSLPMGTVEEKISSLNKALEFMSVVPNLSTETFEGLKTSMKYAAPVAGALKIEMSKLGAALGILADAGFKGEEGGTALRTIMTRAIAPTRQARLEMRAAGIDLDKLYKFDSQKLADMQSLKERLRGAGLGQKVNLDRVLRGMDPSKFRGIYDFQDALQARLMGGLGIKKGDAEARGILMKVIGGHVTNATQGFDLEDYFKGISKLSLPAMKEMFGLQRLSQAQKLREEINKTIELPTGERISKFQRLAKEIERLMPGAIDRRFQPVSQGFAYFIDRTMRALEALRNTVFNTGVGEGIAGFFEKLAKSVENMRRMDPNALRAITYGLAGLATLGPAAIVIGAMATGLEKISGILSNKAFRRLAIGGGIAGLLFGEDIKNLFFSPDVLGRNGVDIYGTFLGEGAPILATVEKLKAVFDQLSGAVGDVASKIGEVYAAIMKLFNADTSGSMLLDGLAVLNKTLDHMAKSIEQMRRFFGGEAPKLEAPTGNFVDDMLKAWRMGPGFLREFFNKLDAKDPLQRMQDSGPGARPSGPVEVNGRVSGEGRITVTVDQEGRLQAFASPMKLSGDLNSGRASPDTPDTRNFSSWRDGGQLR